MTPARVYGHDRGRVILRRPARGWTDRIRAYRICTDGQPVGTLYRGQSLAVCRPPGPAVVFTRIAWCSALPLPLPILVAVGQDCGITAGSTRPMRMALPGP